MNPQQILHTIHDAKENLKNDSISQVIVDTSGSIGFSLIDNVKTIQYNKSYNNLGLLTPLEIMYDSIFQNIIPLLSSGTSGTINSINESIIPAQIISGGTGLTVIDSGTGNSVHTISVDIEYAIPLISSQTNWNTAYSWGNHAGLYDPLGSITSAVTVGTIPKKSAAGFVNSLLSESGTVVSCMGDIVLPMTGPGTKVYTYHPTWPTIWQNGMEWSLASVPRITNVFSYSNVSDGAVTLSVGTRAAPKIAMIVRGGYGTPGSTYDGNIGFGPTTVGECQNSMITCLRSGNGPTVGSAWPGMEFTNTLATKGNGSTTFNFAGLKFKAGNNTVNSIFLTAYDDVYSGMIFGTYSNHPTAVESNGVVRQTWNADGTVSIHNLGFGIVHSSVNGLLTSSAIISADLGNIGPTEKISYFTSAGLGASPLTTDGSTYVTMPKSVPLRFKDSDYYIMKREYSMGSYDSQLEVRGKDALWISTDGVCSLGAAHINLNASVDINVPANIPLKFYDSNDYIKYTSTGNKMTYGALNHEFIMATDLQCGSFTIVGNKSCGTAVCDIFKIQLAEGGGSYPQDIVFPQMTTGIIHCGATGILTSSTIVAADITNNTITNAQLANLGTAGTLPKFAATGLGNSRISETTAQITISQLNLAEYNLLSLSGSISTDKGAILHVGNDTGDKNINTMCYGSTAAGVVCGMSSANLARITANQTKLLIDTKNAYDLIIGTNDTVRVTVSSTGTVTISNLGAGIVHASAAGLLTSSALTAAECAAAVANGTAGTIAKYTAQNTVGNSAFINENATGVSIAGTGSTSRFEVQNSASTIEGLRVLQTTTGRTSSGVPLVQIYDDQVGTTQTTLSVIQNGTGDILQLRDGATTVFLVKDGGSVVSSARIGAMSDASLGYIVGTNQKGVFMQNADTYGRVQAYDYNGGGAALPLVLNNSGGNVGIGTTGPGCALCVNGGVHIGGDSDAGDNNLLVDGTGTITGGFGCNLKTAQTAYASGGALSAYSAGTKGFDTDAHCQEIHTLLTNIRAALVANGIMS